MAGRRSGWGSECLAQDGSECPLEVKMPIELKPWQLDPVTFEECLQYVNGKDPARVITPRQSEQLNEFVTRICYIQGSYYPR